MRESEIALWLMVAYVCTVCIIGIIWLWFAGIKLIQRLWKMRKESKGK